MRSSSSDSTSERVPSVLALVGGAAVAIGSVLPWASFTAPLVGTVTKSGIEGDGVFGLILAFIAVVGGIALWVQPASLAGAASPVITGLLALVLFAVEYADAAHRFNQISTNDIITHIGAGLYVIAFGGALLVLAGGIAVVRN